MTKNIYQSNLFLTLPEAQTLFHCAGKAIKTFLNLNHASALVLLGEVQNLNSSSVRFALKR